MKPFLYGILYAARYHFTRKRIPLICGLVLTNACNLQCRHCRVGERGSLRISYGEIADVIDSFYEEGGRNLYLEGGEPFLWRDGDRRLEDIVEYAHSVGFYSVVVYTNGTLPFETSADTVFVSVDGLEETHDFLRGTSFKTIMANVQETEHPSVYINYTINAHNKGDLEAFCRFVDDIDQIQGVFFYFHTPYYGYDELYIGRDERNVILMQLVDLRKRFRILNSSAGLKSALRNNWERPLGICRVYEKGTFYTCCRFQRDAELCANCGYLSYAEIHQTLRLRPSAIMQALKYF